MRPLLIAITLIALLTACAPQSAHPIDATPLPTIAASATFDAPVVQSRATLPPILDALTLVPTPSPTPILGEDRHRQRVENLAAYLISRCHGDDILPISMDDLYYLGHKGISDDGEMIYFGVVESIGGWDYQELWVVTVKDRSVRRLFSAETLQTQTDEWEYINSVQWLPGTHQIIFNSTRSGTFFPNTDLHWVDADTGEYRQLIPAARSESGQGWMWGSPLYPSPDGKYIATATFTTVSLIDSSGLRSWHELLRYDFVNTHSDAWVFAHPVWSPDSAGVWVAIPPAEGEAAIEVYYLSTSGVRRKAGEIALPEPMLIGSPAASPDGQYVAYIYAGLLHLARVDGTEDTVVTTNGYPNGDLTWLDSTHYEFYIDSHRYTAEIGSDPRLTEQEDAGCLP